MCLVPGAGRGERVRPGVVPEAGGRAHQGDRKLRAVPGGEPVQPAAAGDRVLLEEAVPQLRDEGGDHRGEPGPVPGDGRLPQVRLRRGAGAGLHAAPAEGEHVPRGLRGTVAIDQLPVAADERVLPLRPDHLQEPRGGAGPDGPEPARGDDRQLHAGVRQARGLHGAGQRVHREVRPPEQGLLLRRDARAADLLQGPHRALQGPARGRPG